MSLTFMKTDSHGSALQGIKAFCLCDKSDGNATKEYRLIWFELV